ncbi:hypothetical protein Tco_0394317 [Tanacetum coccineum]
MARRRSLFGEGVVFGSWVRVVGGCSEVWCTHVGMEWVVKGVCGKSRSEGVQLPRLWGCRVRDGPGGGVVLFGGGGDGKCWLGLENVVHWCSDVVKESCLVLVFFCLLWVWDGLGRLGGRFTVRVGWELVLGLVVGVEGCGGRGEQFMGELGINGCWIMRGLCGGAGVRLSCGAGIGLAAFLIVWTYVLCAGSGSGAGVGLLSWSVVLGGLVRGWGFGGLREGWVGVGVVLVMGLCGGAGGGCCWAVCVWRRGVRRVLTGMGGGVGRVWSGRRGWKEGFGVRGIYWLTDWGIWLWCVRGEIGGVKSGGSQKGFVVVVSRVVVVVAVFLVVDKAYVGTVREAGWRRVVGVGWGCNGREAGELKWSFEGSVVWEVLFRGAGCGGLEVCVEASAYWGGRRCTIGGSSVFEGKYEVGGRVVTLGGTWRRLLGPGGGEGAVGFGCTVDVGTRFFFGWGVRVEVGRREG